MWNAEDVKSFLDWADTPAGAFALRHERRLLQHLVSGWPRRGHSLLDVGCGPGIFLEYFWESGFDVTGLDASPDMLAAARSRLGPRADFHLGVGDHLPFEDNAFDYVTLLNVLEFVDDAAAVLAEAFRVAARGVLVAVLNRWSPYYLSHGVPMPGSSSRLRQARWRSLPEMLRLVRQGCGGCAVTWRTVLHAPSCTWREGTLFNLCNRGIALNPFGAYLALRVDTGRGLPVTPLLLTTRKAAPMRVCPPTVVGRTGHGRDLSS